MSTQINSTLVRMPGENMLSVMGINLSLKATSAETNGQWTFIEYIAPPLFSGPAPHWHKQTTEAFYIVAGAISFRLGEQTMDAPAGAFVMIPPHTVHTFANTADAPAKFLIFASPGGFDNYFKQLVELMQAESKWPPADMSKVMALAMQYDTYPSAMQP